MTSIESPMYFNMAPMKSDSSCSSPSSAMVSPGYWLRHWGMWVAMMSFTTARGSVTPLTTSALTSRVRLRFSRSMVRKPGS